MVILGIDPGTKCGWALLRDGERVASGVWDLRSRRHEGGGMRYLRARRYLEEVLGDHQVDAAAYEEVRRHAGTSAAHVYGGIVGQLTAVCEDQKTPYRGIPVGTVKKLAAGKGNASKPAMVAAARERWSHEPEDDNEADALWVAAALHEELAA